MPLTLRCDEEDIDPVTGECAAPYWTEDTGFLPPMSSADAHQIAVSIAALWALAFCIRQIRKLIERS